MVFDSWNMHDVDHDGLLVHWTDSRGARWHVDKRHFGYALPNYPVPAIVIDVVLWDRYDNGNMVGCGHGTTLECMDVAHLRNEPACIDLIAPYEDAVLATYVRT